MKRGDSLLFFYSFIDILFGFSATSDPVYCWTNYSSRSNYLDYLLWKDEPKRHREFIFEFRNSVEHWYPRHPSEGTFEQWTHEDGVDDFGNLCIIQRSINSKFSNLSPEAKESTFDKMIAKGSLKLKIMAEMTVAFSGKSASQNWKDNVYKVHEKEMIEKLMTASNPL